MKILVTGSAGFIGFHLVMRLLLRGDEVIGIDNINDYYDTDLKFARLEETGIEKSKVEWHKKIASEKFSKYSFVRMNLEDKELLATLGIKEKFDVVVNLAAQAGVRYSIDHPETYIQSNIVGFLNILELCRQNNVKHLVFASSSSVYGLNSALPYTEEQNTEQPISIYAASKKSNELMAHAYSHLFNLHVTGIRFFSVYGPWGRPDMAYFIFAKAITEGKAIKVFNNGNMQRDFTFIDDIIEGISMVIDDVESNIKREIINFDTLYQRSPRYNIYNLGNDTPVILMDFIKEIEHNIGKEAIIEYEAAQGGDMVNTWASVEKFVNDFKYSPNTGIKKGIYEFVLWFNEFYKMIAEN